MDIKSTNEQKITPLKALRTSLNMASNELAKKFNCTPAYITAVEKGVRVMRPQMLWYGLNSLEITVERYKELEEFYQTLLVEELDEKEFFKLMLLKSYSIIAINEDEKEQIEQVIRTILKNEEKSRSPKN